MVNSKDRWLVVSFAPNFDLHRFRRTFYTRCQQTREISLFLKNDVTESLVNLDMTTTDFIFVTPGVNYDTKRNNRFKKCYIDLIITFHENMYQSQEPVVIL